jgi:hypothetical protein
MTDAGEQPRFAQNSCRLAAVSQQLQRYFAFQPAVPRSEDLSESTCSEPLLNLEVSPPFRLDCYPSADVCNLGNDAELQDDATSFRRRRRFQSFQSSAWPSSTASATSLRFSGSGFTAHFLGQSDKRTLRGFACGVRLGLPSAVASSTLLNPSSTLPMIMSCSSAEDARALSRSAPMLRSQWLAPTRRLCISKFGVKLFAIGLASGATDLVSDPIHQSRPHVTVQSSRPWGSKLSILVNV